MSIATAPASESWSDKRWLWLLSPSIPLAFTLSIAAFAITNQWLYLLFAPFIIHVAIPILDLSFGEDFSNPPESAVENLNKDFFYRLMVWLYVPFQLIGTVYGAWLAATKSLDLYAYIALVFSVGSINGIGIGTAHELGHKQESIDRWLSKFALAPSMYGHFFVEHNRGHHK